MADAYLEIKPSSGRHFSFPLEKPTIRIGRDPTCDLVIDDPLLSKTHALLQLKSDNWMLIDEGSRNGTFVGGKRAPEKQEVKLKNSDDITLGLTTIRFHIGQADESAPPLKRMNRATQEYFHVNDLRERKGDESLLPAHVAKILVRLADEIIPETEPARLHGAIVGLAHEVMGAERVALLLQTEAGDSGLSLVARHPSDAQIEVPSHMYAAIIERKGIVLMRDEGPKALVSMALPLYSPQGVVGCLFLEAAPGADFDQERAATGAVIGALVGPCVFQTARYKDLQNQKGQLLTELRSKARSGGDTSAPHLVGQSPAVQKLREQIAVAAEHLRAVLVVGEAGTGKEAVARAIHQQSARRDRAFVPVLCGALNAETLARELFGEGTATKPTLYQLAVGGTLFFDDLPALSPELQQQLCTVLSAQKTESGPRLIGASVRPLDELVKAKVVIEPFAAQFGAVVNAPSLRERREDIPAMSRQLVSRHGAALSKNVSLSAAAIAALERGTDRDNVRDLSHVIERAVIVVADGSTIDERHVGSQGAEAIGQSLKEVVAVFERDYVLRVLAEQHGHRTRAAKVLGLSRQALSEKLRKYGLREQAEDEE